jgi:hypothetical protein
VVAICALPLSASAYYLEWRGTVMEPVAYDTATPVVFRIGTLSGDGDAGAERDAIIAAFGTWDSVECSNLSFMQGPDETAPEDPQHWVARPMERYISVYFDDDPGLFPPGEMRVGFHAFGHDTMGTLIGGSIILNNAEHTWSTDGTAGTMDIQGVVTALIGRSLGITSTMTGNATYPRYAPGDTSKRMLGADDIAAISYVYPSGAMGCEMTMPEMICPPDTTDDCPPRVGPMPGGDAGPPVDSGPVPPRPDTGPIVTRDAGPGMMMMDEGDDEGCSCNAPGASGREARVGLGSLLALALGAIVFRVRRQRG